MSEEVTTKKGRASANPSRSALISKMVTSTIFKVTKQKPLGAVFSTMPHVPSRSTVVDLAIGGSKARDGNGLVCPGYPRRRITEIYGAESSGKTTLALAAIAEVQRQGGIAMFLDFEQALHHGYAQAIGVSFDEDKLLYYAPETLEEGVKMIFVAILAGVDLVVVDSVASMVPKDELEKKVDDPARVGALASALSRNLPKINIWLSKYPKDQKDHPGTAVVLLNQVRSLIQTGGYGDTDNSAGGKALKFYSYVRLKLTRTRSDYVEKVDMLTGKKRRLPYGNLVQVKVIKNKADSRQGQTGEIFIRYGFGVDDYHSMIEAGVMRKYIKKSGAFYEMGDMKFRGKDKLRQYLISNSEAFDDLKKRIMESLLAASTIVTEDDVDDDDIMSNLQADMEDEDIFNDADISLEEEVVESDED